MDESRVMSKKPIKIIMKEIQKNISLEFLIEDTYETINIIDDTFKEGTMLTNENKKMLPAKIYKEIDFRHGERYRLSSYMLSLSGRYLVVEIDLRFVGYYK